jgi:hypothetical protein
MKKQDLIDAWIHANRCFDEYCDRDIMTTKKVYSSLNGHYFIPEIRKVIYNPPATIILWEDETKTVVKCCETDIYDPEKGFAMAVVKKLCGNESALFHKLFKTFAAEDKIATTDNVPVIQLPRVGLFGMMEELNERIERAFRTGGIYGD